MARTEARVKTAIWHNEGFTQRSPEAQRLYFLALSQPGVSFCGVVSYTAKRWALLSAKTTVRTIARAVTELAEHRFVVVDDGTEELWIRSFVRHDGVLDSPNLVVAMSRDFEAIHSATIRGMFMDELGEGFLERLRDGLAEQLSDGFTKEYRGGSRVRSAEPLPHPQPPPLASTPHPPAAVADAPDFDDFWNAYPRRTSKAEASKAWPAATRKADPATVIIPAAQRLAADPNLPAERFIPHPASWLRQERWNDPPLPSATGRTVDANGHAGKDAGKMAVLARLRGTP